MWTAAARHWDVALRAAAGELDAAHLLPDMVATGVTALGRAVLGVDVVPAWSRDVPRGGGRHLARRADAPVAVYFPACVSSVFGPVGAGSSVHDAVISMCNRAGVGIRIPERIASLCCGTPWKSKGMVDGHALMRERVIAALNEATGGSQLPVVVDATSCTEGLAELLAQEGITVLDAPSQRRRLYPGCPALGASTRSSFIRRVRPPGSDSIPCSCDWPLPRRGG
jgi:D-lactate dehydrogenase